MKKKIEEEFEYKIMYIYLIIQIERDIDFIVMNVHILNLNGFKDVLNENCGSINELGYFIFKREDEEDLTK